MDELQNDSHSEVRVAIGAHSIRDLSNDESLDTVKTFLAKRKISGWVGIDISGQVFSRYGVKGRPTTVIVDAQGRVAAITTRPDLLKETDHSPDCKRQAGRN